MLLDHLHLLGLQFLLGLPSLLEVLVLESILRTDTVKDESFFLNLTLL